MAVGSTVNFAIAHDGVTVNQHVQEFVRMSYCVGKKEYPSVYHSYYPTLENADFHLINKLRKAGCSVMGVYARTIMMDTLLPAWIENDADRLAYISAHAADWWEVLDGIVYNFKCHVNLRFGCPPWSAVPYPAEGPILELADYPSGVSDSDCVYERTVSMFQDMIAANYTAVVRRNKFNADVIQLCYARYGATECNLWTFSFGCEVGQPDISSNWGNANNVFANANWWGSWDIVGRTGCSSARIVWPEFVGWGYMSSLIDWLYANRGNGNKYLERTYGLSWHAYGTYVSNTITSSTTGSISFVRGSPDRITRASGSWITDGVAANTDIMVLHIDGDNSPNNGEHHVASVSASTLTLSTSNTVTNEAGITYFGLTKDWANDTYRDSMMQGVVDNLGEINHAQGHLAAIATAQSITLPHCCIGEYAATNDGYDANTVSWMNGVWSSFLVCQGLYAQAAEIMGWDDLSYWGLMPWYIQEKIDAPYPLWYTMAKLEEVCNFASGDYFCAVGLDDWDLIEEMAFRKGSPSTDRTLLIWNRRNVAHTATHTITLDSAWPENGDITFYRYEQSIDYPNFSQLTPITVSYTSRTVTLSAITLHNYSLTILTTKLPVVYGTPHVMC